jgi:hypothetical protein
LVANAKLAPPAISLLLPARGRPKNLKQSIDSAFGLANHPEAIELLVRLDECDPCLREELAILADHPHTDLFRIGVGTRFGYARMDQYYNGLAESAVGDWLFFWNDDIDMLTRGWDDLIREAPLFSVQFPRRDTTPTTDYTLPVVGRPIYETLGHLSKNAYCDAWISDFSGFAGTSIIRDDIVFHHHRLDDDTLRGQANGAEEWHRFTAAEQLAMRRADMDKVMAAPAHASRFDGWNAEVTYHVGVDYIKLAAGEARARAYVLKGRKGP